MPRPPRTVVPGQPMHIRQRGNDRAACFVADQDYLYYLEVLLEASKHAGCAVHAYVLMTNHVHLLATPGDARGPARMMQRLGRRYVRYFNVKYARTGTLWEGRYQSALIDSGQYLLACSRYIELNPVRAGMVPRPGAYRWSSARCNAYGHPDPLITPHEIYRALGAGPDARQAAYRSLLAQHTEMDPADAIRFATRAGTVIGSGHFREQIEALLQRRLSGSRLGSESWGQSQGL